MPKIWKTVLSPGVFHTRSGPVTFTPKHIRDFCESGKAMTLSGLLVPIPLEHQEHLMPMTEADRLARQVSHNAGFVSDWRVNDKGCLDCELDVGWLPEAKTDADILQRLHKTIRFVSPQLTPYMRDGSGKVWKNIVSHVCLTPTPVWHAQPGFGSDGAALLSRADGTPELSWEDCTDHLRLSLANLWHTDAALATAVEWDEAEWPVDQAQERAPAGGVTRDGQFFPGGRPILMALAPDIVQSLHKRYYEGDEKLTALAAEAGVSWQTLAAHFTKMGGKKPAGKPDTPAGPDAPAPRKPRPPVDIDALHARVAEHAAPMTDADRKAAGRTFGTMMAKHGGQAVHKLNKLVQADLEALSTATGAQAEKLKRRLAAHHHMIGLAKAHHRLQDEPATPTSNPGDHLADAYDRAIHLTNDEENGLAGIAAKASKKELEAAAAKMEHRFPPSISRDQLAKELVQRITARRGAFLRVKIIDRDPFAGRRLEGTSFEKNPAPPEKPAVPPDDLRKRFESPGNIRGEMAFDDKHTGQRWTYGLQNRPFINAGAPRGFIIHSDRKHPQFRHGTVDYPFPLTPEEVSGFELTPVEKTAEKPAPGQENTDEVQNLLAAFDRVGSRSPAHTKNFQHLADLRAESGLDKPTFDRVFNEARKRGLLTASAAEGRMGITQRDRDAWIEEPDPVNPMGSGSRLLHASRKEGAPDQLPGGKADRRSDSEFHPASLAEGARHELEHTNDPALAKEVAKDHLTEDQDYYRKLKRIEQPAANARTALLDAQRAYHLANAASYDYFSGQKEAGVDYKAVYADPEHKRLHAESEAAREKAEEALGAHLKSAGMEETGSHLKDWLSSDPATVATKLAEAETKHGIQQRAKQFAPETKQVMETLKTISQVQPADLTIGDHVYSTVYGSSGLFRVEKITHNGKRVMAVPLTTDGEGQLTRLQNGSEGGMLSSATGYKKITPQLATHMADLARRVNEGVYGGSGPLHASRREVASPTVLPDLTIKPVPYDDDAKANMYHLHDANGKRVGHISGAELDGYYDIHKTELDEDQRGGGRFQKALQEVADLHPNGASSAAYQTSRAFAAAMAKMPTYALEKRYGTDYHVIRPNTAPVQPAPVEPPKPDTSQADAAEAERRKFEPDITAVKTRPLKNQPLVKRLQEASGRFDFMRTAHETGWATDGRFMVQLPSDDYDEVKKTPHADGRRAPIDDKTFTDILSPEKADPKPASIVGARYQEDIDDIHTRVSGKKKVEKMPKYLIRSPLGRQTVVDANLFETIRQRWPKATYHLNRHQADGPLRFVQGGQVVAVLMPLDAKSAQLKGETKLSLGNQPILMALEPKLVQQLTKRYHKGEKLTALAAEAGVSWRVLAGHLTKPDLPRPKANKTRIAAFAQRKAQEGRPAANPSGKPPTAPINKPAPGPKPPPAAKPTGEVKSKTGLDPQVLEGLIKRYDAGEQLTTLAAEVGLKWQSLAAYLTKKDRPSQPKKPPKKVSLSDLQSKVKPYQTDMSEGAQAAASRTYAGILARNGDRTLHRLHKMIHGDLEELKTAKGEDETILKQRLSAYNHILGLVGTKLEISDGKEGKKGASKKDRVGDGTEPGAADGWGDLGPPPEGLPDLARLITARAKLTAVADPSLVHPSLHGQLRSHQMEAAALAIDGMRKHGGFVLADGTGCVAGSTLIYNPLTGQSKTIADLEATGEHHTVLSLTPDGLVACDAEPALKMGTDELFVVRTEDGREITVTGEHRFLTPVGWRRLADLGAGQFIAGSPQSEDDIVPDNDSDSRPQDCLFADADQDAVPTSQSHLTATVQCGWRTIASVTSIGQEAYYDFHVPIHENYVAEGFINHNSGKTRSQLAVGQTFALEGKKVLIVSKKAVFKPNWAKKTTYGSFNDDSKAMGIDLKVNRGRDDLIPGEVNITTYENLARFRDKVDKDTVLILDESHEMKNRDAAKSQYGYELMNQAHSVMYNTATPADKAIHIEHLFRAGIFGDRPMSATFDELGLDEVDIKRPDGWHKEWQVNPNVGDGEVQRRLTGLMDRMTEHGLMLKREISMDGMDVAFHKIKLSPEGHDIMGRIEQEVLSRGYRQPGLIAMTTLNLMRLQQEPYKVPHAVALAKQELAEGRQVVIFLDRVNKSDVTKKVWTTDPITGEVKESKKAIFGSGGTATLVREALAREGITDVVELHGGSKMKSTEAQGHFQKGRARVIISTVASGGTGINLDDTRGDRPRTMIMMTPPMGATGNMQAVGRIWRLKSKSYPRIRYIAADTEVDRHDMALLAKKMGLLGAAVSGDVERLDVPDLQSGEDDKTDDQGHVVVRKTVRHKKDKGPYRWRPLVGQGAGPRVNRPVEQPVTPKPSASPITSPVEPPATPWAQLSRKNLRARLLTNSVRGEMDSMRRGRRSAVRMARQSPGSPNMADDTDDELFSSDEIEGGDDEDAGADDEGGDDEGADDGADADRASIEEAAKDLAEHDLIVEPTDDPMEFIRHICTAAKTAKAAQGGDDEGAEGEDMNDESAPAPPEPQMMAMSRLSRENAAQKKQIAFLTNDSANSKAAVLGDRIKRLHKLDALDGESAKAMLATIQTKKLSLVSGTDRQVERVVAQVEMLEKQTARRAKTDPLLQRRLQMSRHQSEPVALPSGAWGNDDPERTKEATNVMIGLAGVALPKN